MQATEEIYNVLNGDISVCDNIALAVLPTGKSGISRLCA